MSQFLLRGGVVVVAAVVAFGSVVQARSSSTASTGRPLVTGIVDPSSFSNGDARAFAHAKTAGAGSVRLILYWSYVAPGLVQPGFNAQDPSDPAYNWDYLDVQVRTAVAAGLQPIVNLNSAPAWAQGGGRLRASDGSVRPSPSMLADFSTAAAKRYSGSFGGLPRVRYWQIWNEPNLSIELMPQTENGKIVSPEVYRDMVNAAASAIHTVHADNVVIAGGLAPFGGNSNDPSGGSVPTPERIHPMTFMRQMLCMSDDPKPKPTCNVKSQFDVWAHHPYTYGGPTHHAYDPNDVSIGDLGKMRTLLDAAAKAGHIQTRQQLRFWVTEFSWDTSPTDPKGLPLALHARWVSEALYRMWMNGVSLVTWWLIRDEPFPRSMFQSGLYFRGTNGIASDTPKPALRAFRFPFVAFKQKSGAITYWGRTPTSTKKTIVVEQKQGSRWRRLVVPTVDRYGIFLGKVASVRGNGSLRARLVSGSEVSLPFSLTVPEDFRFCPWGSFC